MTARPELDDWMARVDSELSYRPARHHAMDGATSRQARQNRPESLPYWKAEQAYFQALSEAQRAASRALDAAIAVQDTSPCDQPVWFQRALTVSGANNTLAQLAHEH